MAKKRTKKKRDKRYTGVVAAMDRPKVTRVSVPDRSRFGKWWHENRKKVSRRLAALGIILIFYGLISWIF